MSAPNIVNVATITGKTAVLSITTSANSIVTNTSSSGQVLKVNALYVSNANGTASATFTADVYRSSTAYKIANLVTVPAGSVLDMISKSIYLEEGDSLRLTSSSNNYLHAVCSYEVIS